MKLAAMGANAAAVFPLLLAAVFPGVFELPVACVVLPDTLVPEAVPPGAANANADAGMPPSVSASAAFNAYGTLTSSTRGCSSSLGRLTCTPSQRGSPDANNSSGN